MPYPASQLSLVRAFQSVNGIINQLVAKTTTLRSAALAGPVSRSRLIDLGRLLVSGISTLNTTKALPGIVEYAQKQLDDQALDVAAEFNAMITAATSLKEWIYDNFPKDAGTGAWLYIEWNSSFQEVQQTFSSAQLVGFVTEADAFLATIS